MLFHKISDTHAPEEVICTWDF